MNGRVISLIYFYLVSIIGIVLLIVGTYNTVTFVVNTTQFDKYPLQYGGEDRCAYTTLPQTVPDKSATEPSVDKKALEEQRKTCLQTLEMERKQHKVNNLKDAITFSLIGIALIGSHLTLGLRRSKDK